MYPESTVPVIPNMQQISNSLPPPAQVFFTHYAKDELTMCYAL